MRILSFHERYVDGIYRGTKETTIRLKPKLDRYYQFWAPGPRTGHGVRRGVIEIPAIEHIFGRNLYPTSEPAPTVMTSDCLHLIGLHVNGQRNPDSRRDFPLDEPSPTVTTKDPRGIVGSLQTHGHRNKGRLKAMPLTEPSWTVTSKGMFIVEGHRMLTIAEHAALMSFPPEYRWPKGVTLARRLIGNAVPPLLARKMAEVVKMHPGASS
jgi:site-specific DNA-cytosine methylase